MFCLCFTCGVSLSRKRKDRHEGSVPSGFSRFPAAEGESDEEEDYEKERRKRGEGRGFTQPYPLTQACTPSLYMLVWRLSNVVSYKTVYYHPLSTPPPSALGGAAIAPPSSLVDRDGECGPDVCLFWEFCVRGAERTVSVYCV